jgi:hypothetical protein
MENSHCEKRLEEHISGLERLADECKQGNDPGFKLMLYLLREALELGRLQLKRTIPSDS